MQYNYTPGQAIKENKNLSTIKFKCFLTHNCDNTFII